ncbi:MAG: peptidoglycan-binding domain-containing protein [Thermodesulfobacteriota bacterium]
MIPVEWDADGKVVAVAIAAFDETTYLVKPGGKGSELLDRLQCEVTVWGKVEGKAPGKTIQIERYLMSTSSKGKILGLAVAALVGVSLALAPVAFAAGEAKPAAPAATAPAPAKAPEKAAPAKAAPAKKPVAKKVMAKKAMAKPNAKVKAAQEALNKAGAKLKADGLMGKQTRAAVKKFQKGKGLKVTGKLDAATLKALGL